MKQTVIFIIDTLQTGGAEKSLLEIARHFKKYRPVFVQLFNKGNDLKTEFNQADIEVIQVGAQHSYRFSKLATQVWKKIQPLNPALIHATLFMSDMVSRKLPLPSDVPLLNSFVNNSYSIQRYRSETLPVKIKLWLLQQWDTVTASRVTSFVSNSESIKMTNARALHIPHQKIRVIYRGRSAEQFVQVSEEAVRELRSTLNPSNKKVFLNVSRLIDRKGQWDLIHAFHRVARQRHDCMLWIAGDGPYRRRLMDEVKALGLQNQVYLLATRSDVPALLKAADFFVFPSHYEGLPGAIIEAMLAKVPIIASSIPENRECVNEERALLHPVKNVPALAHQMVQALEDKHWPERTQKAFDYALENFEIKKIAQQYEQLYDELLGEKGRSGELENRRSEE